MVGVAIGKSHKPTSTTRFRAGAKIGTMRHKMNLAKTEIKTQTHDSLALGSEIQKSLYQDLEEWKIIKNLHGFKPTLVGSFPLDIATADSDVDILTKINLPSHLVKICYAKFRFLEGYAMEEKNLHGEPTVIIRFKTKKFKYEIFGQKLDPVDQQAYIHLKVEERIIQHSSQKLKAKIIELKESGIKTEPAFCKILEIKGDSYKHLLDMYHWTDKQLLELIKSKGY